MHAGKALFHVLLMELNEMGLPGTSASLDEIYRSPHFSTVRPVDSHRQPGGTGVPGEDEQTDPEPSVQCTSAGTPPVAH